MKILAWIFIILGIISFLFALISTFNLWVSPPADFEDWFLEKKMRSKLWINAIVDFVIAGWLLNREKKRIN